MPADAQATVEVLLGFVFFYGWGPSRSKHFALIFVWEIAAPMHMLSAKLVGPHLSHSCIRSPGWLTAGSLSTVKPLEL
eukprot:14189966-Heterocapsa_arctica.AAC.1